MQYQLDANGHYRFDGAVDQITILRVAEEIRDAQFQRGQILASPLDVSALVVAKLGMLEHEAFAAIFLDTRCALIAYEVLFTGSLTSASVYPREVVKAALKHNAASVILAHNHPSGVPEPSQADREITTELQRALRYVEVRVFDHLVVGGNKVTSFSQRGLL